MLTNVIAYLHTTLAYQSAVMQLIVGQANFDAQQLHLRETLPIVIPADTNQWSVAMPPYGVTGTLTTSNYVYRFVAGKLASIQMKGLPRGDAETQVSLIDTNGAHQLAQQWLTALSVDVPALESKYPPAIQSASAMSAAPRRPNNGGHRANGTNDIGVARRSSPANEATRDRAARNTRPLFYVNWGRTRGTHLAASSSSAQISMEILGSTRECLNLSIFNPALLKASPLQVANAAALLGPPPSPQQLVENFLGGKTAYNTVAQPERVLVWLVGSQPDDPETKTNRTAAL
ncbi:MAG TPA: hypothetical protein VH251_02045, partial [Verrucomicrobiae bacterium]|nr:hypothetical protein [Verrucomicrobiae bacterium]